MPDFSSFCLRGSALDVSLKVATVTMFISPYYIPSPQKQSISLLSNSRRRPHEASHEIVASLRKGLTSRRNKRKSGFNVTARRDFADVRAWRKRAGFAEKGALIFGA